jgi:phage shock protein PspC (stress-responsive transcriptional regulator)
MEQTRHLYRSRIDRKLAGVGGGLASYSNLDATLIGCCSSCWPCCEARAS